MAKKEFTCAAVVALGRLKRRLVCAGILTVTALLLSWLGGLLLFPGQPEKALVSARPAFATALTPSDSKFLFGILAKGGRAQKTFWLHHTGESTVEITHIETSCDCLEVVVASKIVGPNEKVLATITVDFSHEPNFVGNLDLTARAHTKGRDVVAFEVFAEVSVKDVSE